MSILDWIRTFQAVPAAPSDRADTAIVQRIVKALDTLGPSRARYVACFAYILSRVAAADEGISDAETQKMIELVERRGQLPRPQAVLVVEIARNQNELFGNAEESRLVREFRAMSTETERRELLDCLFVVSGVDKHISPAENVQMKRIASQLGFDVEDYVRARLARRV